MQLPERLPWKTRSREKARRGRVGRRSNQPLPVDSSAGDSSPISSLPKRSPVPLTSLLGVAGTWPSMRVLLRGEHPCPSPPALLQSATDHHKLGVPGKCLDLRMALPISACDIAVHCRDGSSCVASSLQRSCGCFGALIRVLCWVGHSSTADLLSILIFLQAASN